MTLTRKAERNSTSRQSRTSTAPTVRPFQREAQRLRVAVDVRRRTTAIAGVVAAVRVAPVAAVLEAIKAIHSIGNYKKAWAKCLGLFVLGDESRMVAATGDPAARYSEAPPNELRPSENRRRRWIA